MKKKLTNEQIRKIVKNEKAQSAGYYKDEIDLTLDRFVDLYENKKIDEVTFKLVLSLILSNGMKDTVSDLRNDLVKSSFSNGQSNEANKLFLLNYSKKSYA